MIKFFKKWWDEIYQDQIEYEHAWYVVGDYKKGLKISALQCLKIAVVAVPLILLAVFFMWLFVEYVFPIFLLLIALFLGVYFHNPPATFYNVPYSDEIWEELAVRVVKSVTKEPVDVMDINGRFDMANNAYIFNLFEEMDNEILIEATRQRINKKLAIITQIPLQTIRQQNVVSFNGKTVKIKIF